MRLDKYLKVSRLIKRRTVANDACDGQHITVNGRTAKASYDVKVGDVIEIAFGQRTVKVEVLAVTENAKKDDAAAMYRELAECCAQKTAAPEVRSGGFAVCQIIYFVISLPVTAGSMLRDRVN